MKPSRIQYILAHSTKLAAWSGALLGACVAGWNCYPEMIFASRSYFLWFFGAVIIVMPLGCILGGMFLYPFIFFAACKINGAPFRDGDLVHILAGPHKDQLARIYQIWGERKQVRVDLGEQARKDVTDVFEFCEVCREK